MKCFLNLLGEKYYDKELCPYYQYILERAIYPVKICGPRKE